MCCRAKLRVPYINSLLWVQLHKTYPLLTPHGSLHRGGGGGGSLPFLKRDLSGRALCGVMSELGCVLWANRISPPSPNTVSLQVNWQTAAASPSSPLCLIPDGLFWWLWRFLNIYRKTLTLIRFHVQPISKNKVILRRRYTSSLRSQGEVFTSNAETQHLQRPL